MTGYDNDQKAYYAFKIYDMDNDGYISMSDLYDTLREVFSISLFSVLYLAQTNRNFLKYTKPYEGVSQEKNWPKKKSTLLSKR